MSPKRKPAPIGPALAGLLGAIVLAALPVGAGAAPVKVQKGVYSGHTKQSRVSQSARAVGLKVQGNRKRIVLTTEPAVARNLCISAPVFLLDETKVTAKIRRGKFKFARTFVGSKQNRIRGRFTEPGVIEGVIVYHFRHSDAGLCGAGKTRVRFTAER